MASVHINHQTLIDEHNIHDIPCSLSRTLKENSIEERQCRSCLLSIIDKIEFEETININKKHISSIIFGQNKNSKFLNLAFFLLNILEHNFCFKNIHMNESKCFEIFIQTLSQARSEV